MILSLLISLWDVHIHGGRCTGSMASVSTVFPPVQGVDIDADKKLLADTGTVQLQGGIAASQGDAIGDLNAGYLCNVGWVMISRKV